MKGSARRGWARWLPALALGALCGCGANSEPLRPEPLRSPEALRDPATCRECHADHYREWAGSMHAYAARDPVFLAMNRRGQAETSGQLGDFCVKCHAPMAVRTGATADGLNLEQLPDSVQGVTCYFCHAAVAVDGTHNNPVRLADDAIMRGGIANPVANVAHASERSALLSGTDPQSASVCGSCHDILTASPPAPAAVELERTYAEWQSSLFAPEHAPNASGVVTCNGCHMRPGKRAPAAAVAGLALPLRTLHEHQFPGVDTALVPFPNTGDTALDQSIAVEQNSMVQTLLDTTLRVDVCVQSLPSGAALIEITLDNLNAGHHWPSGASQDRQAWVEVKAYANGELEPIYQSGVVPAGGSVNDLQDPDLWLFRDLATDQNGAPAHMFWDVAAVTTGTIPGPVTNNPSDPSYYLTHAIRKFPRTSGMNIPAIPERVSVRVRITPIGRDVLDDLVQTGHLDPALRDRMPTLDLVPNRHLAAVPGLSALGEVTFEWSAATRDSGRFNAFMDTTVRPPKDCIGMQRKPPAL
jgi:Cytochrome c554 and c-prime